MLATQPWDTTDVTTRVLEWARSVDPVPLAEPVRSGPGAYLLVVSSDVALYAPLAGDPAYAGASDDLAARAARHRTSLQGTDGLRVEDVWVRWLPTEGRADSLYVEALLQGVTRPPLNHAVGCGLGSRSQGRARVAAQRPTKFDHLHPGRPWARRPSPAERAKAILDFALHLASREPTGLWDPIGRPLPAAA